MANKYAVLIAVEHYQNPKIDPVQFATRDATELSKALKALGFADRLELIDTKATRTTIDSQLKKWVGRLREDDTFYLFYAGHGFSSNGHNYITCFDTQLNDIENTSVSLQSVFDLLNNSPCRQKVMFLDSCESGMPLDKSMRAMLGELSDEELRDLFDSAEYCTCFASCKTGESSWPDSNLKHGIWTHFLVEALSGNAPKALERGQFVTATALQAFLADEVPRALRKSRPQEYQTPWKCGGETNEFMLADVGPILAARKKPPAFDPQQLKRILLVQEETGAIKSLSGFKKGHHVPDSVNNATRSFVESIAFKEIEEELDEKFGIIRKAFGYGRRDIEKISPSDGSGAIETRDFHYVVTVAQNPTDPTEYVLKRELTNIKNPQIVDTDEFNDVFDGMFSVLEFEFTGKVNIEEVIDQLEDRGLKPDYDAGATYCEFSIPKFSASIVVTSHSVRIVHTGNPSPRELTASFVQFRQLAARKDLKMLPLG